MSAPTDVDTTAVYEKYLAAVRVEITGKDETLAGQAYETLLAAERLTTAELEELISRAGRNYGPMFLEEAYSEAKVKAETVTAITGPVWSSAEFPDKQLDRDTWRWLFNVAGFTVDGKPADRPTEPMTLYRGSVPERRTDWSWTRDRAVAERFAAGLRGRGEGRLWVCEVPPAHMLAVNTGRDEDEVVVETRGLRVEALR
ncbi:hypothetical protein [Streptomyces sp. NPDC005281]|uniref:hypothetical protein n=1 Tax=Streptomyces sp. NPDC005281 TaxID=3155712 RepID=UPI00339F35ED